MRGKKVKLNMELGLAKGVLGGLYVRLKKGERLDYLHILSRIEKALECINKALDIINEE